MKKTKFAVFLTGLGLMLAQTSSFAGGGWTTVTGGQYVQDQILVKFKPGVTAMARAQLAYSNGIQSMQALNTQSDLVVGQLALGQTVAQAVSAYANDPNVAYVQPNYIYHTTAVPTDPQYGQLWAAKNTGQTISAGTYAPATGTAGKDMNLESAWNVQTDCSSVVVAVVDSGVNYNSTDLAANMWTGNALHGQNFSSDVATGVGSDPMDRNGHGTHVAGIIGAAANNGIAGVGVCWKASIMAVRVMNAVGSGTTASITAGVNYAVANGAKVINMSLGGTAFDQAFSDAITNAQANNVLVVVAAGNEANNNDVTSARYPCNFTQANLICVAALDQNYALASFSNWGNTSVDVGAPGTNIYSTWAGTNAVITDFTNGGAAPAGWTGSSTTVGTGGGWGAFAGGWMAVPAVSWGTALYNANTDDRAYKSFNLAGVNVALFEVATGINVKNGDFFNVNYKSGGGDPFVGGVNFGSFTNQHDGVLFATSSGQVDISPCISATCSIGFQLTSALASVRDNGVQMTNFKISTLTLNSTSYNTINGTSMATPEVVGVAALVWAHNPLYTYADVARAIKNGGAAAASLSGKTTTGKSVDAMGALSYINQPTGVSVVVH